MNTLILSTLDNLPLAILEAARLEKMVMAISILLAPDDPGGLINETAPTGDFGEQTVEAAGETSHPNWVDA